MVHLQIINAVSVTFKNDFVLGLLKLSSVHSDGCHLDYTRRTTGFAEISAIGFTGSRAI